LPGTNISTQITALLSRRIEASQILGSNANFRRNSTEKRAQNFAPTKLDQTARKDEGAFYKEAGTSSSPLSHFGIVSWHDDFARTTPASGGARKTLEARTTKDWVGSLRSRHCVGPSSDGDHAWKLARKRWRGFWHGYSDMKGRGVYQISLTPARHFKWTATGGERRIAEICCRRRGRIHFASGVPNSGKWNRPKDCARGGLK